jgi:hypothetical protein
MTPDFLLAEYLMMSLDNAERLICRRDAWWNHKPMIGGTSGAAGVTDPAAKTDNEPSGGER